MFRTSHALQVVALAGFLLSSPSYADNIATSAVVYLHTEPGSWVGGGIGAPEVTWQHGIDGVFYGGPVYGNYNGGIQIRYDDGDYWSFGFAAASYDPATNTNGGRPLAVGFYDNAQRLPFRSPTRPGLDVSGNGRGDNTLSGWFDVLEVSYGANGALDRFAVDFRQFDESANQTGPSLYGSLRFNSAIPVNPVPEPASSVMLLAGIAVFGASFGRKRARTKSCGASSPVRAA
ncbi:MAG: hypothetical protein JWQ01_3254 [Massilia sp.]|nr:hypothetical protein [Massilia sp.]